MILCKLDENRKQDGNGYFMQSGYCRSRKQETRAYRRRLSTPVVTVFETNSFRALPSGSSLSLRRGTRAGNDGDFGWKKMEIFGYLVERNKF